MRQQSASGWHPRKAGLHCCTAGEIARVCCSHQWEFLLWCAARFYNWRCDPCPIKIQCARLAHFLHITWKKVTEFQSMTRWGRIISYNNKYWEWQLFVALSAVCEGHLSTPCSCFGSECDDVVLLHLPRCSVVFHRVQFWGPCFHFYLLPLPSILKHSIAFLLLLLWFDSQINISLSK